MANFPPPGGFLQSALPSPPPSSVASDATVHALLPRQRASPLKPGSQKQSALIDHIDNRLLHISRRYEKRYNAKFLEQKDDDEVKGYDSFAQMANDLGSILDVVWVSGTRKCSYSNSQ